MRRDHQDEVSTAAAAPKRLRWMLEHGDAFGVARIWEHILELVSAEVTAAHPKAVADFRQLVAPVQANGRGAVSAQG